MSEIQAALQLSSLAGWNQTAEDWRLLLNLAPDGCFSIQIGNTVAATATLISYGNRLAWIGMVLTHPDHRRHGLATRLLNHVLGRADTLGIRTVKLDATEHGQPLYQSLGFASEQPVERWSRASQKSNRTVIDSSPNELRWLDADASAFGADRSKLLQAFAGSGTTLLTNDGAYLLTRSGRNTAYLGPCVARGLSSARELFERALESPAQGGWSWDLFPQNRNAVALATELGFAPQRRLLRMFRGEELRGEENLIYALAGFEFG